MDNNQDPRNPQEPTVADLILDEEEVKSIDISWSFTKDKGKIWLNTQYDTTFTWTQNYVLCFLYTYYY